MTDKEFGEFLKDTLGPDVCDQAETNSTDAPASYLVVVEKVDLSETGKDIIDAGKRLIKVNKLLKNILPVLENYHKDLDYWMASYDLDSINYNTSGTPEFKTIDQLESYFNTVTKITNQVKEEV